jgi:hypothetical protein
MPPQRDHRAFGAPEYLLCFPESTLVSGVQPNTAVLHVTGPCCTQADVGPCSEELDTAVGKMSWSDTTGFCSVLVLNRRGHVEGVMTPRKGVCMGLGDCTFSSLPLLRELNQG